MPVRFEDLLDDASLAVRNRRDVQQLYDEVKGAVTAGELNLEGHSLPASLNDWIERVAGPDKRLRHDKDVVSFSLADDEALSRWRAARAEALGRQGESAKPVYVSPATRQLFSAVKELEEAKSRSLEMVNGRKDELVGALSDLQGAIALFLQGYDAARERLRLPPRELPLERVKLRRRRKRKE